MTEVWHTSSLASVKRTAYPVGREAVRVPRHRDPLQALIDGVRLAVETAARAAPRGGGLVPRETARAVRALLLDVGAAAERRAPRRP